MSLRLSVGAWAEAVPYGRGLFLNRGDFMSLQRALLVFDFGAFGPKLVADFPKGSGVLSAKRKGLILNITGTGCCLLINLHLFPALSPASSSLTPSPADTETVCMQGENKPANATRVPSGFPTLSKAAELQVGTACWQRLHGCSTHPRWWLWKQCFHMKKRNKCKPHDWGSGDVRQGNRAPPKAVCRSLLLFSPASPLDLLGWSLDRAMVQMLPAPFLHPMCFSGTRPAAAIPSSPKAFPLQRANRKDLCGFEHVLEWGGFLCLLWAGTSPHHHLKLSRWQQQGIWLTWVNRLKVSLWGTPGREPREDKLGERHHHGEKSIMLPSCFQDTSITRKKEQETGWAVVSHVASMSILCTKIPG